ncbi:MAG: hypothetical protein ACRD2L_21115 [Terriglobia bacterium]
MNDVFRDPTGRDLILTEDCWSDHIIQRHPEMVPFKALLQETVETPDAIYQGKRNVAIRVYKKR